MGVNQEDHDALLVEVQRLEAELGKVRQDLLGVAGCKGKCEQLDTLQETVSNTNSDSCLGFTVRSTQCAFTMERCHKSLRFDSHLVSMTFSDSLCFIFPDISPGVLPGAQGVAGSVLWQWWLRRGAGRGA